MARYSKKEARWQFYILFFAFLGITLYFIVPQFINYFTGKEDIEIDVRKRKETQLNLKDAVLFKSQLSNSQLVSKPDLVIKMKSNSGWGIFFVLQEFFGFVLLFAGLWFLIKFLKALQSEDQFENNTQRYVLRLGQLLIFSGLLSIINKYFMNFYLLDRLGYAGYKSSSENGEYLLLGVLLIYFSRYYKRGLQLQQENNLRV